MVRKMLDNKPIFGSNCLHLDHWQYLCLIKDVLWKYSHGFGNRHWKSSQRVKGGLLVTYNLNLGFSMLTGL